MAQRAAKSERKRRLRRKQRERQAEHGDFLSGRSDHATLSPLAGPVALGFSPVQATAAGAGSHGKHGRARSKAERSHSRRELARGDW